MFYFSAATGGFYDDAIHATRPEDCRPVTAETYAALLDAQAAGQVILADASGDPISALPPPPATPALLAALRVRRDRLLSDCDWTQLPDAPLDDATRAAWRAYRQTLRDLPETTTDPSTIEWPTAPSL